MRWFFLSGGFGDFRLLKASFSDPLVQRIFREAEPTISV